MTNFTIAPRSDCTYRSSLIWVYTVWPRGFYNILTDHKIRRGLLWLAPFRVKELGTVLLRMQENIKMGGMVLRRNCSSIPCADPEGGGGGQGAGPPLKNRKNIGFLAIQVRIPWKIAATKPSFNIGPSWCFAGGPIMACLKWYLDPPCPH